MPSPRNLPPRARVSLALLALWCVALAAMTLRDTSPSQSISAVARWVSSIGIALTFDQAEAIGNVGIFIPLGLLTQMLGQQSRPQWSVGQRSRSALLVTLAGAAVSLLIELLQGRLLPDRVASLQDVALNALGTAFGAALAMAVVRHRAVDR